MTIRLLFVSCFAMALFAIGSEPRVVPFGHPPVIDGAIMAGEWEDGARFVVMVNREVSAEVKIKHDGRHLTFLYQFKATNPKTLTFPELFIDPLANGGASWQSDDWWFHLSGTDCESQGKPDEYGNCQIEQPDWRGVPNFAMGELSLPLFTFEVQIPLSKLSLSLNRPFAMVLAAATFVTDEKGEPVEAAGFYPQSSLKDSPSSWGLWVLENR